MAEAKNDRRQALDLALSQIERQFGKGAVMRLGTGRPLEEIAVIPTGALSLDVALGVGGLPRGRVVEIYGPESSGKTTVALHVVAEAQRPQGPRKALLLGRRCLPRLVEIYFSLGTDGDIVDLHRLLRKRLRELRVDGGGR